MSKPLRQSAQELLSQLSFIIKQLEHRDFAAPVSVLSGSSIGQHVRHTIEFFICLTDGEHDGELNYDNRKHDRFMEEDKHLALTMIDAVKSSLDRDIKNHDMYLITGYDPAGEEVRIPSNFYRELAYNIEHTIHHMALIHVGIKAIAPYVTLPEHFGVAPSTVRYRQNHS